MRRRRWIALALVASTVGGIAFGCSVFDGAVGGTLTSTPMGTPVPPERAFTTPSLPSMRLAMADASDPTHPVAARSQVASTSTPTRRPRPTSTVTPSPTPTSTRTRTPTATPSPTVTPTPFILNPPVLIGVTPTVSDTTPVPTAVPVVQVLPKAITIVLLGSDRRPDWNEWHTDVVQVVSVQPAMPAVSILSIPRDLYVYIPDFWMSRVNFADMYGDLYSYEGGGPALIQQTLLYNLGIPVDHYVRVDFDGFIGIVNILGGVDIPVHCRLEDHWPYPDENGDYPIKVLEPGVHPMDGETALWYARSRKTSSVFARERRQQQVLEAIWRQARSLDVLPRLPQLWDQYRHMVVTDLHLVDVLRLAEVALRLDSQNVRTHSIGYQHVTSWTTPKGGNVFLPNWEMIEPLVAEAMGPVPAARTWRTTYTIEVWNGTDNATWDQLAADRLWSSGFGAVIGESDRRDYPHTQLVDFTPTGQGGAASYLQWMFKISPENVIAAPDPQIGAQYRLIIGADYQTCPGY
jgi:LCP family protein required for cell wall assembly